MAVELKRLTYQEYLETPETNQGYEILDGEMIMTPAPTPYHQGIIGKILFLLQTFITERNLGVVLGAPVDVIIQKDPLRTRQPDILFLSAARTGISKIGQLRAMQVLKTPPDLVVEVLSPSNSRDEMLGKLEDYRKVGVRECWVVSPEAETVEVLQISAEGISTLNIVGIGGTLGSELLTDFTPSLKEIFK
jgi:Uma2 family endonuclease